MSRILKGKIFVRGSLEGQTPLSVSGSNPDGTVDLALAVDGQGNFFVPGTGLTGPFRHWMENNIQNGSSLVRAMLGYQKDNTGHASYLLIEDGTIQLPNGLSPEIRQGIQIDRKIGVSRHRFLYNRTVLPKGARITFNMTLECPEEPVGSYSAEDFEMALRLLLDQLTDEEGIRLGAGKTRGLGRVKLVDPAIDRHDFMGDIQHVFNWLRKTAAPVKESLLGRQSSLRIKPRESLVFTIQWHPVTPVMVKSGTDGMEADIVPLVSGTGRDTLAPVISGSSWKGVFRSHAAKVLRTLLPALNAPDGSTDPNPDADLKQTFLEDIFGFTGRIGRLGVDDVYQSDNPVPCNGWENENPNVMDMATQYSDHVAICRFTGGAASQALFNLRHPRTDRDWEPIRVTLNWEWKPVKQVKNRLVHVELTNDTRLAELALCLIVIQDMARGLVPVGFASCRGMGLVQVDCIRITGCISGRSYQETISGDQCKSLVRHLPQELRNDLDSAWTRAIENRFILLEPDRPTHTEVVK